MKDDGLFAMVGLMGALANGPSNCGSRSDGKICTAQGGECRYNYNYYSPGMRDAKSWQMPSADESCPARCGYLQERPRDMGNEEERRKRANSIMQAMGDRNNADELVGKLALGMMGIDTREF